MTACDRVALCFGLGMVLLGTSGVPALAADPAAAVAPLAVAADQVPSQIYDAGTLRLIVASADTGGRYAVLELNEGADYRTPAHVHPHMDESFYVLSGTLELNLARDKRTLPAGSFVFIPRGTPHAQGSAGPEPVRLLTTFTPGGFDAFFLDRVTLARTTARSDPQFQARIMEIVARHQHWLQPASLPGEQ